MARKSKANNKGDNAKSSKKQKVSETEVPKIEEPVVVEEEEEDMWEGSRVIPPESAEELCRVSECNNFATATWVSQLTGDEWNMCTECQLRDFGECYTGPTTSESKETTDAVETKDDKISKGPDRGTNYTCDQPPVILGSEASCVPVSDAGPGSEMAIAPQSDACRTLDPEQAAGMETEGLKGHVLQKQTISVITPTQTEDECGDDGGYNLTKILSMEELQNDDAICCSQDACGGLPAFGLYVNSSDLKDRWYYCLDCQEADFEGWPPLEELPVKRMEPDHLKLIATKCSRKKNPRMPVFSNPLSPKTKLPVSNTANSVTPCAASPSYKDSGTGPSASFVLEQDVGPKQKASRNARALEAHKKWLEAAQALGGKDARIVVSKPAAKKLIYDFLFDAFCPMNITQVYKGLKAVVPQPVLNACLQEMVPDSFSSGSPFPCSDDEEDINAEENSNSAQSEPYAGALVFKAGKNASSNLYYMNYTRTPELDRVERDALFDGVAKSSAEESNMTSTLKALDDKTKQLISEPTNEELAISLATEEKAVAELEEQVGEAQKLKVNEKHRKNTKARISKMAAHWRQRKRICEDFLNALEENTDGAVTKAKCLKGDGPIALDSDEAVAKAAVEFRKQKLSFRGSQKKSGPLARRQNLGASKHVPRGSTQDNSALVAVVLDNQLQVQRVYEGSDA